MIGDAITILTAASFIAGVVIAIAYASKPFYQEINVNENNTVFLWMLMIVGLLLMVGACGVLGEF